MHAYLLPKMKINVFYEIIRLEGIHSHHKSLCWLTCKKLCTTQIQSFILFMQYNFLEAQFHDMIVKTVLQNVLCASLCFVMKCKSMGLFPGPKSSKSFNLHYIQWSICQWVNPFPGHVSKETEQSNNHSEHDKSISSSKRTWPHSWYTYLLGILQMPETVFLTSVTFNCIQIQSCTDPLT